MPRRAWKFTGGLILALALFTVAVKGKGYPLEIGVPTMYLDSEQDVALSRSVASPFSRRFFKPGENLAAAHDSYISKAASFGMRVHALIGQNYYDVAPSAYASFCVEIIKRYGPGGSFAGSRTITTFELMNEPWFGNKNPKAYIKFIKPALKAIKKLRNPKVKVIVIVAGKGAKRGVSWIKGLYKALPKLNSYIAGFAVHPYWNGHSPFKASKSLLRPFTYMDSVRAAINCRKGKAKGLYVTEYGTSTFTHAQGVTLEQQKSYLNGFLSAVKSNKYGWKVQMFSIYDLKSFDPAIFWKPTAPLWLKQREANFGLLDMNGNPKPAYSVYQMYKNARSAPNRKPKSSMKGRKIYGSC
jgi:hypothetical protein